MSYLNNNHGVVQVLFALVLTVILGAAALVIDVGMNMAKRIDLSNSLDAAALAGATELPAHPDRALLVVDQYLEANGTDPSHVTVTLSEGNQKMHLLGAQVVENIFARVLGINTTAISADATVIVGTASSVYGGIRPLAVVNQPLVFGQEVTLKEGAGDATAGNYNAVSFGGDRGAAIFRDYLEHGYPGRIAVGDIIDTEPGNMASSVSTVRDVINLDEFATYNDFEPNSPRNWTVPVVENWDVNGRDQVRVMGFAEFFIDRIENRAGNAEIVGRFVQFTTNGDIDISAANYGVYGVRLVR